MPKLKIDNFFCKSSDPYENIKFKNTSATIRNFDGSVSLHWDNLIMPEHWEQTPIQIMARNYLRKSGVPTKLKKVEENGIYDWIQRQVSDSSITTHEHDARQVFDRLAGTWTYWGIKGDYFETEQDAKNFFNELRYMLAMQIAAPNSPQWFNTGIYWAYGIEGSAQGHFYFDEDTQTLKKSTSAYIRPQPHACFIQSINDSLVGKGGILDLLYREAILFKYGSGTGTNFSSLRAAGEKLSGGGTSSGLMSFLKIGDVAAGSIKSGGTTRRAAKMVILDVDHPEIIDFIQWKDKEENKVLDLYVGSKILKEHTEIIQKSYKNKENLKHVIENALEAGLSENYIVKLLLGLKNNVNIQIEKYELDWNSKAYESVFGQNSNNSVRLSNTFIQAVLQDENFDLKSRTTDETVKTLKARYIWDEIAKAAWSCADPGVQFDTTINDWNTCSNSGKINGSNPCSEYMFLDDTACNLASLNLIKFIKNDGSFNLEAFEHSTRLWTIVLEISVYMAQFPSEEIAIRSYQFRTLGLGYGNLGALLMQLGIGYDSDEGRNTAAGITALMQGVCYQTSAEMAQVKGSFPKFEENKDCMLKVISNHMNAAKGINTFNNLSTEPPKFYNNLCIFKNIFERLYTIWDTAYSLGNKYGYRNAQVSVIAPTGTIGLVMDFKTTGIEPQFAQVIFKQLSGGGMMKFVNDDISKALKILEYTQEEIKKISQYVIGHSSLDNDIVKLNKRWLSNIGFYLEEIDLIEKEIPQCFDLNQAFNCLDEKTFERLNIKKGSVLEQLKLQSHEIEIANLYYCGNMTIEGAPCLKTEHLNIFDCSLPSGNGVRSLSYQSHIKMMAAIQPFLSGAISKTINLPNNASIQECQNAYLLAWRMGLKSVALYRDGSKYSQVLHSKNKQKIFDEFLENENEIELFNGKGYTKKILINKQPLIYTVSEDQQGIVRNININYGKEGSTLKSWVGAWSTLLSMYIQKFGKKALLKAYKISKNSKFEPMGQIKGNDKISHASSIPDYILEDLILTYPDILNEPLDNDKDFTSKFNCVLHNIKIGQDYLEIIISYDMDGFPHKIFASGLGNEGSDLKGWMNSCLGLLSMYIQDAKQEAIIEFINKFENSKFSPSGIVKGFSNIRFSSSPLDFLAQLLKINYSNQLNFQTSLLEINNQEYNRTKENHVEKPLMKILTGYIEEPCKNCKAFKLKSNGSCYVCEACGATTGCS